MRGNVLSISPEPEHEMITLNPRQHATVLAALRYYQNDMDDDCRLCPELDPDGCLHRIATNDGQLEALSGEEIDELCEELNFSPQKSEGNSTKNHHGTQSAPT